MVNVAPCVWGPGEESLASRATCCVGSLGEDGKGCRRLRPASYPGKAPIIMLWRSILKTSLRTGMLGIALAGCSAAPIRPTYTQDELKAICERRGGRWHDGDPLRSFCEYKGSANAPGSLTLDSPVEFR